VAPAALQGDDEEGQAMTQIEVVRTMPSGAQYGMRLDAVVTRVFVYWRDKSGALWARVGAGPFASEAEAQAWIEKQSAEPK
jgi:hypothetical protein